MLLAEAKDVRVGTVQAKGVYAGDVKDWPSKFDLGSIPGLVGWYDADQLTLLDGAPVNPWPDLSGHGYDMVSEPTYLAGSPPTVKANGRNGRTVVHYAHNGDNVLSLRSTAPVPVYGHFFVVAWFDAGAFPDYNGLLSGPQGADYLLIGTGGGTGWYGPGWSGTWGYDYDGLDARASLKAPMLAWAQMGLWIDQPVTGLRLQIGIDRTFAPRYWHGDVAELICYDHHLAEPELLLIENYLREKWGLP